MEKKKNWIRISKTRVDLDKVYAYRSEVNLRYDSPYRILLWFDICSRGDESKIISWGSIKDDNPPKEWEECTAQLDKYFEIDTEKISL